MTLAFLEWLAKKNGRSVTYPWRTLEAYAALHQRCSTRMPRVLVYETGSTIRSLHLDEYDRIKLACYGKVTGDDGVHVHMPTMWSTRDAGTKYEKGMPIPLYPEQRILRVLGATLAPATICFSDGSIAYLCSVEY